MSKMIWVYVAALIVVGCQSVGEVRAVADAKTQVEVAELEELDQLYDRYWGFFMQAQFKEACKVSHVMLGIAERSRDPLIIEQYEHHRMVACDQRYG